MRVLVISDIHANLPALEAVLQAAGQVDAVWCLGDIVGYGPDPNQCIHRIRSLPNLVCLLGNHDAAALDRIDIDSFNLEARMSVRWMQTELDEGSLAFLARLPERVTMGRITLAHGSPRNPVWEYILDPRVAAGNFDYFETDYCFVGHTHLPVQYLLPEGAERPKTIMASPGTGFNLEPRAILNPGSVGQPRDHDPRAAYAVFDSEPDTWEFRRVEYDIASVQKRIVDAGLPQRHAIRLAEGW
jgi:diadenosine tetraphosphatase ApaH/serine/threonine PP2A family protein phosphatase